MDLEFKVTVQKEQKKNEQSEQGNKPTKEEIRKDIARMYPYNPQECKWFYKEIRERLQKMEKMKIKEMEEEIRNSE